MSFLPAHAAAQQLPVSPAARRAYDAGLQLTNIRLTYLNRVGTECARLPPLSPCLDPSTRPRRAQAWPRQALYLWGRDTCRKPYIGSSAHSPTSVRNPTRVCRVMLTLRLQLCTRPLRRIAASLRSRAVSRKKFTPRAMGRMPLRNWRELHALGDRQRAASFSNSLAIAR